MQQHVWLLSYITFWTYALLRTWTSLVSVKSWKNMTRSWTRLVELNGVWLMWMWLLFTPARRLLSSSLRQRWLLTSPQTRKYKIKIIRWWYSSVARVWSSQSWRKEIVRELWRGWEFLLWGQLRSVSTDYYVYCTFVSEISAVFILSYTGKYVDVILQCQHNVKRFLWAKVKG